MKVLFSLLVMSFSSLLLSAHDVPVAVFHIYEADTTMEIDITFDLDDFTMALEIDRNEVDLEIMQAYLERHTSFKFNDKSLVLSLSTIRIAAGHIKVTGNLGQIIPAIKTVEVENTCLNKVTRHSNVIQLDLNNTSKDYRMHKDRTSISLMY